MPEKCFCHFNGYEVKDAFARTYAKKASRQKNLLDNSNFRNPVMQAGFDGFHGTARYPIDRWYDQDGAGVYELTENGLGISAGDNPACFCQRISDAEKLIGKTLTLAVCATSGEIFCTSGVYNNNTTCCIANFGTPEKLFSIEGGYVRIYVAQAGIGLRWIALYEGEYTAETVPEYQPKGYAEELAECQRYFIKISGAIAYGIATAINSAEFTLPIPVTMRNNYPSYTFENSVWAYRGDGAAVSLTVTGAIATHGTVRFLCTTESSLNVSMCVPDVNCEISADL